MGCDDCGGKLVTEKTPNKVHYARKICDKCGKHHKWVSSPDNSQKDRSTNYTINDVLQVHKQDEKRCFFCRRKPEQLGINETLEIDHIHELQRGGTDRPENMQILCTACHKLKNHQRLYHNWHQIGREA